VKSPKLQNSFLPSQRSSVKLMMGANVSLSKLIQILRF
jgi:hypothetical protein